MLEKIKKNIETNVLHDTLNIKAVTLSVNIKSMSLNIANDLAVVL